ncbi:MAG: type II toxin-antitoxin system RelE/ParE family toxin [Levilactobacillus sp.]|uniref:type II toxin-antitoxin system RelE/ParE family toxin n=1 Tax=Levilactobacillus sp. TaxID=2767919 RepID=UPI002585F7A7|nr:type II toxin-antitoxin system RelE/ParE family toxin [Levilactobacillus sp.]MCI1552986.1 type II toxin-antitoxin system RelE/ParE family toxin [Levilactobacillus sp.]MCI1598127.1 type II toxin-antitoxin system RelE/ParE family toxin [Levilactobacillus sp.]MCI1605544.1 type II toxin-antitoxin system RelE/ParE family toxin [Levilactobacillus sp.]
MLEFSYYDWEEFQSFLSSLPKKDAAQLAETLSKIQKFGMLNSRKQKWVRELEHNLFEIRSRQANNIQRVIYFHFENDHYVITHGFTKKTQKTPQREIQRGRHRRTLYTTKRSDQHD